MVSLEEVRAEVSWEIQCDAKLWAGARLLLAQIIQERMQISQILQMIL